MVHSRGRTPRLVFVTLALTAVTLTLAIWGVRGDGRAAAQEERESAERTVVIRSSTQVTVGSFRVGAGNIWEEVYTPDGGKPSTGLTAGLWISAGKPETSRHLRVHPGQVVRVDGFSARVVEVRADAVTLAVPAPRP